jgi:hypothetical protein
MSTTTETTQTYDFGTGNWKAGVLGGIAGSAVMGALILVMNPPTLAVAIPSLYGLAPPPSPGAGLVIHLSHGAVMGVMFAGLVSVLNRDSAGELLGLGIGWGVVTWAVFEG